VANIDESEVKACFGEIANEYLRIGAESCNHLQDGSQLSAFLLLGARAVSIAMNLQFLVHSHSLDTYDAVRRAFLEAYYLQNEFRLKDSASKATRWLQGENGTWQPDFNKVEQAMLTPGPKVFGPEYGNASKASHPTHFACVNSVAVLSNYLGKNEEKEQFQQALQEYSSDISAALFRLTWSTFASGESFLALPIDKSKLAHCVAFHDKFQETKKSEMQSRTTKETT